MSPKIIGFTATDKDGCPNETSKDVLIVNYHASEIAKNNLKPICFKFTIWGYKKDDSFTADFSFKLNNHEPIKHQFNIDNPITDNNTVLKKNGEFNASQFTFTIPLLVSEGIVTCEMSLKRNDKEIDHATTYFAFRNIDNMRI